MTAKKPVKQTGKALAKDTPVEGKFYKRAIDQTHTAGCCGGNKAWTNPASQGKVPSKKKIQK